MNDTLYLSGVVITCGFAAGWCAALFRTWYLKRFYLELEYRLSDLEARVIREVKIRAGAQAQKNRHVDDEILKAAAEQENLPLQSAQQVPPFMQWREQMKGRK